MENGATISSPLDLIQMVSETVQNPDAIDACILDINDLVKGAPAAWAYQKSPESDVGILLNRFGFPKIVLLPFRLTFRMFSQTSPTPNVRETVRNILGEDYEHKFGFLDTHWEEDGFLFVETAVFDADLKVAKGISKKQYSVAQREVDELSPFKATCANIVFSRRLAQAVGTVDTNSSFAFHTCHPQQDSLIASVVQTALAITPQSVDMIVGREDPQCFLAGKHYAADIYSNRFLADGSWNKKLSALVKGAYWAQAREAYYATTGAHSADSGYFYEQEEQSTSTEVSSSY